jgi:hypothetical protein
VVLLSFGVFFASNEFFWSPFDSSIVRNVYITDICSELLR